MPSIHRYRRFMPAVLAACLCMLLPPGIASALVRHNTYAETTDCDLCHVLAALLVENDTAYLRAGARSIPTMKNLNGNKVPSMRSVSAGSRTVGCTFCHYNTVSKTRMKDVLEQFGGQLSQHPVDRGYTLDNAAGTRNVSLSPNTNTTRWMSNWDNSWVAPRNQIGCTDCHDVANAGPNAGTGPGGYPDHADPASRTANPVMLRGGAASWNGKHATNGFCVDICHNGLSAGTSGYRMGHYGWGAFDNAGRKGQLKEPCRIPLRTSNCVDCHETHYAGSQRNLFGELGDNGRLLPSQSTSLVVPGNCTGICHNDDVYVTTGHGRPVSTSGIAMRVACNQCHDSSVSHRSPANPKRLFSGKESVAKATLTENLLGNGLDDDYDGVIDDPGEAAVTRSGESNCSTGSCHSDRHLHRGTIGTTTGSASCLQCHDMHGNGVDNNIRMIKSTILGMTVEYRVKTDYFRSDDSATKASLCDNPKCHAKRLGAVGRPGTILGDVADHASAGPGTDCSGCHPHASTAGHGSFAPK